MKKLSAILVCVLCVFAQISCERVDVERKYYEDVPEVELNHLAQIFSAIPIGQEQMREVYDAVNSSSDNGYDEEYTMSHLFENPGSGVGDEVTKAVKSYSVPLKDLIEKHVNILATKSEGSDEAYMSVLRELGTDGFIKALRESDMQIYWPYSSDWDGGELPIITFDPENNSKTNYGYRLVVDEDGNRRVEELVVDEQTAEEHPVWVINRNSDAKSKTLEMLRKENPEWGEGGTIVVRPRETQTKNPADGQGKSKCLILERFMAKRNYDSWFAGASEFYVKVGAVEDFTASTEAEMRLYNPSITDFLVVVRRKQVGQEIPFNAILVTNWTPQMESCALMITEDDGGTQQTWKCSAVVKIASKSYGFEIGIPLNTRDDIVWRGQLNYKWLEANNNVVGHFGDVDLTFRIEEY